MAKRVTSAEPIRRQILQLRNRVSFLERALRNARREPSQLSAIAKRRDDAEIDATNKALNEYHERRRIEQYRESSWLLAIEQRLENERNDCLLSKGLKPEPSSIPKEVRRQAQALAKRPPD